MSSPSDPPDRNASAPLAVIIGSDDDPALLRLLAAGGAQPRVVRLLGASSEGRQLLELTANPGPVVYSAWPEQRSPQ